MDHASTTMGQTQMRQNTLLSQVYAWMTADLLVTSIVAAITAYSDVISAFVFDNVVAFFGLLTLEFVLVFTLSATAARLSPRSCGSSGGHDIAAATL